MLTPPTDTHIDIAKSYSAADSKSINDISIQFSLSELRSAIATSRDSSPCIDNINYSMLQHLPNESLLTLLNIINNIWIDGSIPRNLKQSIIIPLLKPGKDPLEPNSYRPVALTSCLSKIMERMVNNRLVFYIESNNILPNIQCGFRKNRSTIDHLTRLADDIHKANINHKKTTAVFIDLNKAFDRLDQHILLTKLQKLNITGNIYRYIHSFLNDRTATIKLKNRLYDNFNLYSGSPQGSIISPTLFLLLLSDFPLPSNQHILVSLFADDIAIWCISESLYNIVIWLQPYLDVLSVYFYENKLVISQEKTIAVVFAKSFLKTYIPPRLFINNQLLSVKDEARFLGIIFDKKLNFNSHSNYIAGRCNRYINIMKYLTGTSFRSNFKTLKTMYNALIRSTLNYGCEAYHTLTSAADKPLNVIRTKALRICLGTLQSTPNIVTIAESNEIPLSLQRLQRLLLYVSKILLTSNHVAQSIITNKLINNTCLNLTNTIYEKTRPFFGQHQYKAPSKLDTKTPPWLMMQPTFNTEVSDKMTKATSAMIRKTECELLINSTTNSHIHLFCDASKGTDGTAAIAVYNPLKNSYILLKLSNNTPIYAAELIAIHTAISWLFINATPHSKAIIFTDCLSALNSIKTRSFKSHPTIIHNLLHIIHQIYIKKFITIEICHIFSHIGVTSNEAVDAAANLARLRPIVNLHIEPEYVW